MMAAATFTGLDSYKLSGVKVTNHVLGRGSYATVLELEYMGLKCAGKKIHDLLLMQGNATYAVHHFQEECQLLSKIHHPNIVQFLGVYFQDNTQAPILVMEYLPTNLTSCIEDYGILPEEVGYPILHGVALGLCYLHNRSPPIIHRDLSSSNVLLTSNLKAKISDLGVARILNMSPLQANHMTQTPGTPAYMPPEVMIACPKYDESVDVFSFGVMMIHAFCGKWPEPQVGQIRIEADGKMIPVSEAERRDVFLKVIGIDHPVMGLLLQCINNSPRIRPHVDEIVKLLAEMVKQFSSDVNKQLDKLLRTKTDDMHISHKKADSNIRRKPVVRKKPSREQVMPEDEVIEKKRPIGLVFPEEPNLVVGNEVTEKKLGTPGDTTVSRKPSGTLKDPVLMRKLSEELEVAVGVKKSTGIYENMDFVSASPPLEHVNKVKVG